MDAYAKIGEQLPLLLDYEELFGDNPHMIDALQWIYVDILTFHKHALRFFQSKSVFKETHGLASLTLIFRTEAHFQGHVEEL